MSSCLPTIKTVPLLLSPCSWSRKCQCLLKEGEKKLSFLYAWSWLLEWIVVFVIHINGNGIWLSFSSLLCPILLHFMKILYLHKNCHKTIISVDEILFYFLIYWLSLDFLSPLIQSHDVYICISKKCNLTRKIREEARIFPWNFCRPKSTGIFTITFWLPQALATAVQH